MASGNNPIEGQCREAGVIVEVALPASAKIPEKQA
jgi:hypothetical protein